MGGALIFGQSGAGKSALALEMISRGAQMIADDRTKIASRHGDLWASPVSRTRGLIEVRGVGILHCPTLESARLILVIDLDQEETDRLPPRRETCILNHALPVIHARNHPGIAAAALLWLAHGRAQ